uniref:Uncharacterized protein n=1 Tax=Romanomermis culicivorax TaxID=13658 RepID=A0A915JS32_ROMCU
MLIHQRKVEGEKHGKRFLWFVVPQRNSPSIFRIYNAKFYHTALKASVQSRTKIFLIPKNIDCADDVHLIQFHNLETQPESMNCVLTLIVNSSCYVVKAENGLILQKIDCKLVRDEKQWGKISNETVFRFKKIRGRKNLNGDCNKTIKDDEIKIEQCLAAKYKKINPDI